MKRTVLIEVLLLFVFSVLVAITWKYWSTIKISIYYYEKYYSVEGPSLTEVYSQITSDIVTAIFATLGGIVTVVVMVLVALLNLPAFQPLRDKFSARKQARLQAKAEKAEADKQARIERLQNELEELKRD